MTLEPQLRRLADTAPGRPVLLGRDEEICAVELLARVQELALYLRSRNVNRVGLLCDNGIDWIVADLACQFEGICVVPVPTFFSDAQLHHVVESVGFEVLLHDSAQASRIAALASGRDSNRVPGTIGLRARHLDSLHSPSLPQYTAKITFTSGSTGAPKGVCLSTEQCLRVARSLAELIPVAQPRHLCVLPLATLLENVAGVYLPLILGGSVQVPALGDIGFAGSSGVDARRLLAALECAQPETLILVPQLLGLLDAGLADGWVAPESLQFIAVGGGRVAPELLARVRARGLPVYEGYGISECASVVSLNTPEADRPGSCGRILPHLKAEVQDGELTVKGNTFLGYLGQPTSWVATEVRTGDLVELDQDGFVSVHGRRKNVLISSYGRNICPEWVESELQAEGEIAQAVVFGDNRPYCVALLCPASAEVDDRSLQAALARVNSRLPDYAQVRGWHRLPEPLNARRGLLTSNGRPRRELIARTYGHQIDLLYPTIKESVAL